MINNLTNRAAQIMLDLITINSPSGQEKRIRGELNERLKELGFKVEIDAKGNLTGYLEATPSLKEKRALLFCAHMDTVPTAVNVRAKLNNNRIESDGTTALGADDKAAIAAFLAAVENIKKENIEHQPIIALFTVEEEIGLEGIKKYDFTSIANIERGYVLDASGEVGTAITSSPGKSDATVIFHGKAAHAGFGPENGISAIMLASRAIDKMELLRVDEETTANIGTITGGTTTNIVADRCELTLEVRSSTTERINRHLTHFEFCCIKAINDFGGSYQFLTRELYQPYFIDEADPTLNHFKTVCANLGINYQPKRTGGGSDANIIRSKGLDVITLAIGYEEAHTLSESIELEQLEKLTALIVALCKPTGEI